MKCLWISLLLVLGGLNVACSDTSEEAVSIFAASSLIEVLPDLLSSYEEESGVDITIVYGGSNHLGAQIKDGAPIDLYLTADIELLDPRIEKVDELIFASNYITLAVPVGSEKNISSVTDLTRVDLDIAVCAKEVPCGKVAEELGVVIAADTYEPSVRSVISRLTLGEVDLGVVYATDTISEPRITSVWPENPMCPCVDYHGVSFTSRGSEIALHLASEESSEILTQYGFLSP